MAYINHQDWNPVVIKKAVHKTDLKDPKTLQWAQRNGKVEAIQKLNAHKNSHSTGPVVNARTLEGEGEEKDFHLPKMNSELKKQIIKARTDKKLTQAQLAQQVNEKPQVIQEYESGKAIPNPQVLSKISRVLGVHLKRN